LEKFNVTLYCFCGRPIGMLVESMQGNPSIMATGYGARQGVGKSRHYPPSSHSSLRPPKYTSKTTSVSVQPFLRVSRSWPTGRQTDHATQSAAI